MAIFEASVSTTGQGVSAPLIVRHLSDMTVTVIPTVAAKCQYSTSTRQEIDAGSATWIDWPSGNVSSAVTDAFLYRVIAVRLNSSAAAKLEVVGRASDDH